jgi:sarcosine oxidase
MTGSPRARVAVVGAGVMGAASAWALARRGLDVVVVERFAPGHARGGSHGATRIFRLAYPDAELVGLAQESLPLWRRLEEETGERLLHFTGLLDVATDVGEYATALDARGVSWEALDAAAVAERFGIRIPERARGLLQPEAGVVFAERSVGALLAASRARGARLSPATTVRAVHAGDDGVELETDSGTVRCDAVVVAAGAWANRLLAPLGIELPLTPTRETVVYFRRDGESPSVIDEVEPYAGALAYGLFDPRHGLKTGFHQSGTPVEPDDPGEPDAELVAAATEWAHGRFPGLAAPAAAETCLYANLPGDRFAVERHGRVVVASACSGHGFKFAPAVGERVSDLILAAL